TFPHPDWDLGGFLVTGDFRPVGRGEMTWDFVVGTSARGDVTLDFSGEQPVLACGRLIDLETGDEFPTSAPLVFRQDGPEHRFRFVVRPPAIDAADVRAGAPDRD